MASYFGSILSGLRGQQQDPEDSPQQLQEKSAADQEQEENQPSQGYMSSLLSKGAAGLKQMGSSPEAFLELTTPPNQRPYFQNGDEISGTVSLEVPFDIQHEGIKVTLRGTIANKSTEAYFSKTKLVGMMPKGQSYEFMQLTRNVDGPGTLNQGTFDYQFSFKNVDMETDSYLGIILDVTWTVQAEMVYKGSMMNYTVKDSKTFTVRNNKPPQTFAMVKIETSSTEESKELASSPEDKKVDLVSPPTIKIEYQGFRDSDKPCTIEVYLHQTNLNIDRDIISGYLKMKEMAIEHQNKISSIRLQLVQQEIQGSAKSLPPPLTGKAAIEQLQSGVNRYLLRVVKDFQIVDGCCEKGDFIDFRLPLRAACSKYMTPTAKNVFNKFSLRYFVRIVLQTISLYRVESENQKKEEKENGEQSDDFEHLEECEEELTMETNFIEVVLWR